MITENINKWAENIERKCLKIIEKGKSDSKITEQKEIIYKISLLITYKYLENFIEKRDEKFKENYFKAFIYLKNWAKENCIYGNKFGFLDGTTISLMIMKVLLLYPDTNFVELIERFFLTYSTWLGYLI
ncbi:unnamed protein product [Meloidogyne enterolobii]|uniref:Uncharacterized protein n=1 Tax=Meloidogyne enterolobii TaxID=390850 RepID=A0ACB0ZME9_MELEN